MFDGVYLTLALIINQISRFPLIIISRSYSEIMLPDRKHFICLQVV